MSRKMIYSAAVAFSMAVAGAAYAQERQEGQTPSAPKDALPPPKEQQRQATPAEPQESKPRDVQRQDRPAEEPRRKPSRPAPEGVPYIGVVTRNLFPELAYQLGLENNVGVLVEEVMPDSPAEKAGIRKFDVIIRLDGEGIRESTHLADRVRDKQKGDQVTLQIIRRAVTQDVKVTVDEHRPPPWLRGFPGGSMPREHTPFGSWGHRFDRWLQEEARRERERERDKDRDLRREREPELTADMIADAVREMEKFAREFKEQQQKLEDQLRDFQERLRKQIREYQERQGHDRDQTDPAEPRKRDDSIMRSTPQRDAHPDARDKA